ncbi:MAG: ATP-binding protein [Bacteroidia bacterium]
MNVQPIETSLQYLATALETRLKLHFGQKAGYAHLGEIPPPSFEGEQTAFTAFIDKYQMSFEEYVVLLMALAPHIQPQFFDSIISSVIPEGGDFPQIGGVRGQQFRGFLPTGETALFLLAGENIQRRFEVLQIFSEDHFFSQNQILYLEPAKDNEPEYSGRLSLYPDYVSLFTLGTVPRPRFGIDFPAQHISTLMEWDDLVLNAQTLRQIRELESWIQYGDVILNDWGMRKRIKPGYRALFYGPAGTGKTLTASLLGKYTGREVYKVDLSMVVSKFIGETEKNLATLFARAENKGWILFFDEADSLFGKRTQVRDAHDKYANQEVSYLLQRIEDYDGLVILASNFKGNIDEAFMRRFQSVIHFPIPRAEERLKLWTSAIPAAVTLEADIDLAQIAGKYELTGANVMNIIQYASLRALTRNSTSFQLDELQEGIARELAKEGKIV